MRKSSEAKSPIMATIYLIRHGQASFGMANYDQLSDTGRKQAAFLPHHFRQAGGSEPAAVYCGSMQRQRQTGAHAFPEAALVEQEELNEFAHEEVLRIYRPELFGTADAWQGRELADIKAFIRNEFPRAIQQWIQGREEGVYQESFLQFKERCMQAFDTMLATARAEGQKEVVAVTSGGVISMVMMQLLRMPDALFPELNLSIANASVTAFLFNNSKASLAYFNNYSHLPRELLSFR